jgi:hypothetical protein
MLAWMAFSVGGAASGQDLARGQGVADRARPEFDAVGLRLGSFMLYPALELGAGYDSNVLAEDTNRKDSAIFPMALPIVLESDWTRHALALSATPSYRFHTGVPSEDYWELDVTGTGTLDVLESADFTTSMSFRHLVEPRGSIDAVATFAEPTQYNEFDVIGTWRQRFNRLNASISGGFTRLNYDDISLKAGGKFDMDFRDRDVAQGRVQTGYSFAKGQSAFVRGTVNNRNYGDLAPMRDRDSFGWEVVAGWASELTDLVTGEVYVGYLDQSYDSSFFTDVDGVSFGAALEWYATELVTVSASAARDVTDSTTPGVGGILVTKAALGADYELLRNVLLNGEVSYENGNFKGSSREDDMIRIEVGGTYLLSRTVHLDLEYSFAERWSNAASLGVPLDYSRHMLILGVRFQL